MQPIPEELRTVIEPLPTKSARIRALGERGYERADIARFLDIRYQHVRNVLEADRAKTGTGETRAEDGAKAEVPGHVDAIPLSIDAQGRLTIPRELREAMLTGADGKVTARVENGELRVIAPRVALRRAQEIARKYKKPGESVVDEFLAERRAMWGEE